MPDRPALVRCSILPATSSSHGRRSASVSGCPAAIFSTLAGGCRVVALLEVPAEATGEHAGDGGLAAAGHAHQHQHPRDLSSTVMSRRPLPLAAGLPEHVARGVGDTAEDEQQIREPVEVEQCLPVRPVRLGLHQQPAAALGTSGGGAGRRAAAARTGRATGQDEAGQLRQFPVELVAPVLQALGVAGSSTRSGGYSGSGTTGVQKSAPTSKRSFWIVRSTVATRSGSAPRASATPMAAVGLVAVGIGLDARIGLAHPGHVTERGRTVVARLRVDASQMNGHAQTLTVAVRSPG